MVSLRTLRVRGCTVWSITSEAPAPFEKFGCRRRGAYLAGLVSTSAFDKTPLRKSGYSRTQEIADATVFLGFTGLVVPSARWDCTNLVVFTERTNPGQLTIIGSPKPVDWTSWREHRAAVRGRT
ncbi:RES domain-containing protein [Bradyrhizobium sp.]|uniref:RES domain-containing protein n=1 Tax=Bradyrhizobium sp. TaxID=376 RepID=UPI00351F7306